MKDTELALSLRDMEKHRRKVYKWNIYKSLHIGRWVVWTPEWVNIGWPPMKFDTWQEAIDYVNGKVKS